MNMKTLHQTSYGATVLAVISLVLLAFSSGPAQAASATWLASPTDGNWITSASENNWSTGVGTWPGGNSTSSGDTATFNSASSFTTVVVGGTWNIKNITFDTANCPTYTITNTGAGTARMTAAGTIQITSTVTQPQAITGSQLRLHTTGAVNLVNNSATPTATLTVSTGFKANNSTEATLLDQAVNLQGSNTGSNVVSGAIVDYDANYTYVSAVTKSGAGTWYLTANNTYKGPTIISGGTLALTGAGAISSTTNIVINGAGATLSVAGTLSIANPMFVTNSGTLLITNTTFRTPVTVTNLTLANATLRLGVNGATPFTNIVATSGLTAGAGGIVLSIDQVANIAGPTTFPIISYTGADPDAASFTVSAPSIYTAGPVTVDTTHKLVTVALSPMVVSTTAVWVGATNDVLVSNWDLITTNWLVSDVPGAYSQFGPVQFDDTASNSTVSLTTVLSPGLITVTNSTLNYTFNGGGSLSGAASLLKQGSGTLVLDNAAANTYSGGTTITNNGVLQLGNNDANGSLGSGPVTNGASLVINRSDAFTLGNAIYGSGSLTKTGNGTLTLTALNSYSGQTFVNSGSLILNGTLGGGGVLTNAAGSTLGGTGTSVGPVNLSGTLNPGAPLGTFTALSGVTLESGANLVFDLNTSTTIGGGVNDLVNVASDLTVNNNSITLNFLTPPTLGSPYRLINFGGNLNGSFNPIVLGSHYTATLDQSTPNQINVTLSGSGANLTWNSTSSGVWDIGATANWLNQATASSDLFYAGDTVLFDDSVAGAQTNITLGLAVAPTSVTVNSANNYSISGSGKITGTTGLTKNGSGTLTLRTTNDFTGAVAIQNGTILIANTNALGSWNSGVVNISSGGALDLGGLTSAVNQANPLFGAKQFNIAGNGPAGNGALVNSGAFNQQGAYELITLTADATFGGTTRWDMRNGTVSLDLAGHKLTKISTNQISLVNVAVTAGDIDINQGVLSFESASSVPAGGTITVNTGGSLGHYRLNSGALTRNVVLNGGGITNISTSNPVSTNDAPISLTANSILGGSSTATYPLYLNGVIAESGGSFGITKAGAGPVVLTAVNTYSGNTLVVTGAVALSGSGSIANSANVTVSAGATLDASARSDGTFTLGTIQTLAGRGTVNGNVVVPNSSTAVIHPGGGGAAAATLTVSKNLTLNGSASANVVFDLSSTYNGANDQIVLNGNGATLDGGNGAQITVNSAGTLDTTHDYVLFNLTGTTPAILGSFAAVPAWAGVTPQYAAGYSIIVSGTQVKLHFTPLPVTVTGITAQDKTYDGGTAATLNLGGAALVGLLPADVGNVTLNTDSAVGAFSDPNVGNNKLVTISGLSLNGGAAGNYLLTQPSTTASITAASVPGEPGITSIKVLGGNVTVSGTNVSGSFGHAYYLVTSDSLTTPQANWLPLVTNTFAADGSFTSTVSIGGASQFYRILVPLP
jgi:autotransporter-associated beta strand protein